MIRIYCNTRDIYSFSSCLSYQMGSACKLYNDDCDECHYSDNNIEFIEHDLDNIIIETDDLDINIKCCIHHTFYNYISCGVVDFMNKKETCGDCRFWYDNIDIRYIK